jgi:Helix-turn-helix domain
VSDEKRQPPNPPPPRARLPLPDHPVRIALLDLLAELGTVTSTEAAARLGHSSGLCSFHLRQLARHGLVEEAPHDDRRARPWRLRWDSPSGQPAPAEFDTLTRDLEDTSYQHWLAHRDQAPSPWQHDESSSAVLHLTPDELTDLATAIRNLLAPYRERPHHPTGTLPVAAITRLFPLLPDNPAQPPPSHQPADKPTDR